MDVSVTYNLVFCAGIQEGEPTDDLGDEIHQIIRNRRRSPSPPESDSVEADKSISQLEESFSKLSPYRKSDESSGEESNDGSICIASASGLIPMSPIRDEDFIDVASPSRLIPMSPIDDMPSPPRILPMSPMEDSKVSPERDDFTRSVDNAIGTIRKERRMSLELSTAKADKKRKYPSKRKTPKLYVGSPSPRKARKKKKVCKQGNRSMDKYLAYLRRMNGKDYKVPGLKEEDREETDLEFSPEKKRSEVNEQKSSGRRYVHKKIEVGCVSFQSCLARLLIFQHVFACRRWSPMMSNWRCKDFNFAVASTSPQLMANH